MPDDASDVLTLGVDRAMRTLRERAAGQNVLAVLTDSTADEWHRRWERSGGNTEQIGLIECFDLTRGAAATQTTVVSDDLAVATIERPIDADQLRSVLGRFLDGWEQSPRGTVVYLESLAALTGDTDRDTVDALLGSLSDRTEQGGVVAAGGNCAARDIAVFGDTLGETAGQPSFDTDAPTAVRRLRTTDPTTFGYFRSYWREAIDILDGADRSYVQAGQLADETELSARMLGATLSALAELDALALRADTNGPNRYDCRNYDPKRAAELGLAVKSLPE
jgi:hypothetical protein